MFRKLPRLGLMTGYRSAATYRRERPQVDSDNLFVTVALTGQFEATQLGRDASMGPGDAFVGTGAEPVSARVSDGYRSVTLSVPIGAMSPTIADLPALFGRCIPDSPALRHLTRYLDLFEETDAAPALQHSAVTHVHDLLTLVLGAARDATETAQLRGGRAARLREIKTDIEAHLGDEGLSVAAICGRHRLPVRYVQRLFESEGITFTEFVLERRLARAHRLLSDTRLINHPIGALAFEAGFTHQPYFSRAFRQRFGVTPSDVRAQTVGAR